VEASKEPVRGMHAPASKRVPDRFDRTAFVEHVWWSRAAHAPGQLDWQLGGCERAFACGVPAEGVVNAWDADELVAWTSERGRRDDGS
jgi:hypothetical protein